MSKILIVDDDIGLCDAVSSTLASCGYVVDQANDPLEAEEMLFGFTYDLIILDWMMPHSTGIEFLSKIRASGLQTPVIMLTGMSSIENKSDGFDTGADDYLTKPFHMKELLARVRAVLRRPKSMQESAVTLSGFTLDTRTKEVHFKDEAIKVTRQEYLLLEFLMRNPGQVFPQEVLVERAWSSLSESSPDTVRVHMSRLRKKLKEYTDSCPIETVHGLGYKFVIDNT